MNVIVGVPRGIIGHLAGGSALLPVALALSRAAGEPDAALGRRRFTVGDYLDAD